jgi:hypothetical protein
VKKAAFTLLTLVLMILAGVPGALHAAPDPNPAPANDYITGRVTIGPSNPANAVLVIVYTGTRQITRSLTGNDGRYYISGLGDKTYTIVVRKQLSGPNLFSASVSLPTNRVYNIKLP